LVATIMRQAGQRGALPLMAGIAEDAIQHVALRAIEGRVTACALDNDDLAVAWCKRVFANFVRDELRFQRRRVRQMPTPPEATAYFVDQISWRRDTCRFMKELRTEAARGTSERHREERIRLLENLITSLLDPCVQVAVGVSPTTVAKRKIRGRILATHIWASVRSKTPRLQDLDHVARALGLDVPQNGPRVSSNHPHRRLAVNLHEQDPRSQ
jgi:hypothetical protein